MPQKLSLILAILLSLIVIAISIFFSSSKLVQTETPAEIQRTDMSVSGLDAIAINPRDNFRLCNPESENYDPSYLNEEISKQYARSNDDLLSWRHSDNCWELIDSLSSDYEVLNYSLIRNNSEYFYRGILVNFPEQVTYLEPYKSSFESFLFRGREGIYKLNFTEPFEIYGENIIAMKLFVDHPPSFKYSPYYGYFSDKNNVYLAQDASRNINADYMGSAFMNKVYDLDSKNFNVTEVVEKEKLRCKDRELDTCGVSLYSTDGQNYYYALNKIKLVGNKIVEVLPYGPYRAQYAADDLGNVYLEGEILPGAKANDFRTYVFQPYEGCYRGLYSVSQNQFYFETKPMNTGVDEETFEVIRGGIAKDKNNYYKDGLVFPEEFLTDDEKVCLYG